MSPSTSSFCLNRLWNLESCSEVHCAERSVLGHMVGRWRYMWKFSAVGDTLPKNYLILLLFSALYHITPPLQYILALLVLF